MTTIFEPARELPIWADVDICVIGGSCTGVFAAIRAARSGASVVIIERTNCFGGVATNGLVLVWHTFLNTVFNKSIIAGLSQEVIDRLIKRDAVETSETDSNVGFRLNTEELKIELDMMVLENRITPMLHTHGCQVIMNGNMISAIAIENKDGRGAIRAKFFIDATGDGDISILAGVPFIERDNIQPPTTCAKVRNFRQEGANFADIYREHHAEFGLSPDSGWDSHLPGIPDTQMVAQMHVFGANTAHAEQLTHAEIEGRRQIRGIMDMLRKYGPMGNDISLVQLASYIGTRETRVMQAKHCLTEEEVLNGVRFSDAIANGSYRVDVHAPEGGGFLFKYLDGTTLFAHNNGCQTGRWREEIAEDPTFYQIPYRCLYHPTRPNLLFAGRMICTDRGAFGAIRVMVNLNQTGEAAGTAAALALKQNITVEMVDPQELRESLADGGSVML